MVNVSDIFYVFPFGWGKGESDAPRGEGVRFLLKITGGGGGVSRGGAEGLGGCLQRIGEF